MLYYRMINKNDNYFPHIKETIVFNELKTACELKKMHISTLSACFEPVYISKKKNSNYIRQEIRKGGLK